MKVSGDTLLFVFECEDGYGQQLHRLAVLDNSNNTISISLDMGKREDGYYTSYMPYPFISDNGALRVVGQDDRLPYLFEPERLDGALLLFKSARSALDERYA